jgi:hypothetical protein
VRGGAPFFFLLPVLNECADEFVAGMEGKWRNQTHRNQWVMTLTRYTEEIRPMPVNMVETAQSPEAALAENTGDCRPASFAYREGARCRPGQGLS